MANERDPRAKTERLNIRTTEDEKALLEQAADASHQGLSQFVLRSALRSAGDVLADQTRFVLPADTWQAFAALLDRPARVLPTLREAASRPSPFAEP
jgi:uncharacterized protein (DUF1778 family)